ncbi:ribokinase-like isoform X2 [Zophobas morio]|uniref:ribokinase-like isoform X2 n=1 Tax=Zophobas morio TaxID=2755281 RepID=UPI003083AE42
MIRICVFGSCNVDLTCLVSQQPKKGETILGNHLKKSSGGKGGNQAVMAARLGAKTSLIGMVGEDIFGDYLKSELSSQNVIISYILTSKTIPTGIAFITVDQAGENQIVVCPGANTSLSTKDLDSLSHVIADSSIFITQLECDPATALHGLKVAKNSGVTTIFNPSPVSEHFNLDFFKYSDFVILNETEAAAIIGDGILNIPSAKSAVIKLRKLGCSNVILTLGANGALVFANEPRPQEDLIWHCPGVKVPCVVDSSGAGDSFIGDRVHSAVDRANKVAAAVVEKQGTQQSFPKKSDLPKDLFRDIENC